MSSTRTILLLVALICLTLPSLITADTNTAAADRKLQQFADDSTIPIGQNIPYVTGNPYKQGPIVPIIGPSYNTVERYQIILWTSIILVFLGIGAVYTIAFMDIKKDTMLYSSFNPVFEDKKTR